MKWSYERVAVFPVPVEDTATALFTRTQTQFNLLKKGNSGFVSVILILLSSAVAS